MRLSQCFYSHHSASSLILGFCFSPGHISTYEDPWRSDIVDMFQNKGYSTPASQTNYFTRSRSVTIRIFRSVTKLHCRLSGFSAQFWDSTAPACSCEWVCVCARVGSKKIELSRIETQDKHGQFHSIPVLIGLTVCWVLPTASRSSALRNPVGCKSDGATVFGTVILARRRQVSERTIPRHSTTSLFGYLSTQDDQEIGVHWND